MNSGLWLDPERPRGHLPGSCLESWI